MSNSLDRVALSEHSLIDAFGGWHILRDFTYMFTIIGHFYAWNSSVIKNKSALISTTDHSIRIDTSPLSIKVWLSVTLRHSREWLITADV